MIRKQLLTLLTLCVCVLSLASSLTAEAQEGSRARPFMAFAEGAVTAFSPPELGIEYTGQATHLGRFTQSESLLLGPNGTLQGAIVFVAANGDELYATIEGAFTSESTVAGTYTFTGGTGRFVDATGTANFQSKAEGADLFVSVDGTIHY